MESLAVGVHALLELTFSMWDGLTAVLIADDLHTLSVFGASAMSALSMRACVLSTVDVSMGCSVVVLQWRADQLTVCIADDARRISVWPSRSSMGTRGSSNENVLPRPGSEQSPTCVPNNLASRAAMASPSP